MKRKNTILILAIALSGLLASGPPVFAGNPVRAFVSILPQKYFVEQIGRKRVHVQVMVRPGASPATYEPRPGQMADLSKADLYFSIGVPFEKAWLGRIKAANPRMRVVATDQGIEKLAMASHHHREEDGEPPAPGGGHHRGHAPHGIPDPHIWLSPPLVKIQVRSILAALQQVDPAHGDLYEANAAKFVSEIDALDADLRRQFSPRQRMRFMVFHPSWGYFARAYGLDQIPIELEGKDPKPAQLQKLIAHAREDGIRVVFVQPQFSARSAALIAGEIGGRVAVADPLAENWAQNLRTVAMQFISK